MHASSTAGDMCNSQDVGVRPDLRSYAESGVTNLSVPAGNVSTTNLWSLSIDTWSHNPFQNASGYHGM